MGKKTNKGKEIKNTTNRKQENHVTPKSTLPPPPPTKS